MIGAGDAADSYGGGPPNVPAELWPIVARGLVD